ncbi:hypothetical protein L6452_23770 [Arctium lappa]|uniref:Uncharacterized protein n=1 Tax=Arctium lappa TaxID=4217 RepID=A0ACB9A990_ARCLA|nr:hypothetical protein L6452_23770 [Arctium lappa]
MLDDPFLPSQQLQPSMEKVSSPLSGQILEFCESELFPETLQNSEVASTSNCCYYEDQTSYTTTTTTTTNLSFPPPSIDDHNYYNATTKPLPTDVDTNNNFSNIIFERDELEITTENDINLDFTTSDQSNYQFGHQDHEFDLTLLQFPLTTDHIINNSPILPYPPHPHPTSDHVVPVMGGAAALPPTVCHEDDDYCLSMPPSKLMRFNNNPNSFMDHHPSINSYLSGNSNPPLPLEINFNGNNLLLGNEIFQPNELGDIFCPDPLPRPYNELQALSNESQQHLVNGGGSSATPLASEITSLEPETFRVTNKLTTEERKEKIHRYMKKRNERNFSKKIKVVVKEEEDNFESSDIFAHISGLNSFKCNYPAIQSWI